MAIPSRHLFNYRKHRLSLTALESCSVVVDTRNMHGHSIKLLGEPKHVTVNGVRSMFSLLGFDVRSIFMGTATRVVGGAPSDALTNMSQINMGRAEKWKNEGAEILEGILAERGGVIEEKQVDVLCALKVVELAVLHGGTKSSHTIFILTEDMDLDPAANLATRWGAKVIRVAPGRVHQRTDNASGWMLITRKDFHALCNFPGKSEAATKLRRSLVRTIMDGSAPRKYSFVRYESKIDCTILRSNQGLHVKMEGPHMGLNYGDRLSLCVRDVRLSEQSQSFPDVYGGELYDATYLNNVVSARVLYWSSQDRISVEVDGNKQNIPVPTGESLVPGDGISLMVRHSSKFRDRSYVYLGPNEDLTPDAVGEDHLQFGVVSEIERDFAFVTVPMGRKWVAKISSFIGPPIKVGSQIRVVDTGYLHPHTGLHLCLPLSSALSTNLTSP